MASKKTVKNDRLRQNKVFYWIAIGTGVILSIPLIAMQFTTDVNWDLQDFIIMGALLFGSGFLFVQVARITPRKYRTIIGIAFLIAVLLIWAELGVGIFGTPFAGN